MTLVVTAGWYSRDGMEDQLAGESNERIEALSRDAWQAVPTGEKSLVFVRCVASGRSDDEQSKTRRMPELYARRMARLMEARLFNLRAPTCAQEAGVFLDTLSDRCDVFLTDGLPPVDLIRGAGDLRLPSLLVSRHASWPIRRMLLLMRGQATDRATVEWGVRLAQRAGSQVTLLVVLPPDVRRKEHYDSQLADILARDTIPGRYVRQVLNRLVALDIEAVLRLRQGALAQQVRQEVARGDYDLVVTSAEPPGRLLNGHLESLIVPLLQWTPAPVLVARYPTLWSEEQTEGKSRL